MESMRKQEFAVIAQDKARAAMRDAQRQVMELRDGRLIVKQAEEMESHLATLEDRLSALEDRLEGQMDRMEEQMERMADLFERLLDRLEDRD
jgi:flagellar capping protein FliD